MRAPSMRAFSRISSPGTVRDGRTSSWACGRLAPLAAPPPELRPAQVLGRFHEVGIATADIRDSVEFYERLGFTQAATSDAWNHPYGVLSDGRLAIGLHQRPGPSPVLTFVLPELASQLPRLEQCGVQLSVRRIGDEVFNEIGFADPFGQAVTVLEARTYSPVARAATAPSACGYFDEVSLPVTNFETARQFWERLGFVATEELESPYLRLPLTSDNLDIAFHRPRTLDMPMLVFRDADMAGRLAGLRERSGGIFIDLPPGLDSRCNALLQAPEGTMLALLQDETSP